jgi:hypothetical protein
MQDLVNESFTEFQWMPFVIGMLGLLVLRAAVHGTVVALVDVTMLFVYFGAFSLWSFGYKLYRYGHDLSPTAAVQVPPFMPPMFGGQQIANFEVYSYPRAGTRWSARLAGARLAWSVELPRAGRGGALAARCVVRPAWAFDRCCRWASRARGGAGDDAQPARLLEAGRRRGHLPPRPGSIGRPGEHRVPAGTYEGDLCIDRSVCSRAKAALSGAPVGQRGHVPPA